MDQNWMNYPRQSDEYKRGLNAFLDHSFSHNAIGEQISCPCKNCKRRFFHYRHNVYDHLVVDGFVKGYKEWILQRERAPSTSNEPHNTCDDIGGLLHDTFRNVVEEANACQGDENGPNKDAKKFYKLVEEGKQELYPGCKTFSKLSFLIRLYLIKCLSGLNDIGFDDILELLREAFPMAKFPKSLYESKKIVKDLGLDYKKIHACPNDCILYRKEYESAQECPKCNLSRWKSDKVPAKVLRHFPLKPRLQRMYMCSQTAKSMVWHHEERPDDGKIRHPADGKSWKNIDSLYPNFKKDARNVRLALSSDGFNPFRTMSISHSTWPVVLINYNLPPWLSMKPEYFMLSLLIPGPKSPGNDIDIYLQPLIDELKELWDIGAETYDAFQKQTFQLHAALMGTINDFPAYSMLSGWRTKRNYTCPCCNHDASPRYLKHSKTNCYMDTRRFLDMNHPWRQDEKSFDGKIEDRCAPRPLSGKEVLQELENFENDFGKTKKSGGGDGCWKKKPVFFDLPYWADIECRHNLDVMHIEKNVFDSVIGTLLDIPEKTKDHTKARFDLMDMGIKPHLHPYFSEDDQHLLIPPASFTMGNAEKDIFLKVIREAKLPYGYASNLSRCVQVKERKLVGYKSHDAHVMLHHLIQVGVRKALPKSVAMPLIRVGNFFRHICSKVVSLEELETLANEVVEILCEVEKIFPPAFFDIMMHLPTHLVDELKFGGPVQYRWMYFVERYLGKLKSYVRNRSHPEGCIAEGYWMEECLTFCSRYLHDGVKTRLDRRCARNRELNPSEDENPFLPNSGHPISRGKRKRKGKGFSLDLESLKQAHRYCIFNCNSEIVDNYIMEHQNLVNSHGRTRRWDRARAHSLEFIGWFQDKIQNDRVEGDIFWLAKGPNPKARRHSGYFINGYRFHTWDRDSRLKTQNYGVTLTALTSSFASKRDQNPIDGDVTYYGIIKDIIELDFWSQFSVVLFKCDWFLAGTDDHQLTYVNFKKRCYKDDPFVLASQVRQVFFVQDPVENDIHYVMKRIPRDFFDFEGTLNGDTYWEEPIDYGFNLIPCDDMDSNHLGSMSNVRSVGVTSILDDQNNSREHEEDSDYDDTDWDWMHVIDDPVLGLEGL